MKIKTNIAQRRWQTFKQNKRAYISLIIFSTFFILSLCSELIANDKPLFMYLENEQTQERSYYFPFMQNLTEKDLGRDLPISVDFQAPYIQNMIDKHGFALWTPIKYSYDTISYYTDESFPSRPSKEHWLGTDDHGRDILARILYGFRISVLFGLCLCIFGSVIGVIAGLAQGYYGGKLDLLFQRFMELWAGIPTLYLIMIVSSVVIINFWILLGIMLLFSWMGLVGIVRAESLKVRNIDYIRAALALGVPDRTIMFKHILPNATVALIATMPFQVNASIVALTSLDFLGFGLPAHYPSLGEVVSQGKNNLYAPWIAITAFFTIGGMLTTLVFIGEGVRDAFDPRVFLFTKSETINFENEEWYKELTAKATSNKAISKKEQ